MLFCVRNGAVRIGIYVSYEAIIFNINMTGVLKSSTSDTDISHWNSFSAMIMLKRLLSVHILTFIG